MRSFTTMASDEKEFDPENPQCFDYLRQMGTLEEDEQTTVTVDLDHLASWNEGSLHSVIAEEYYR